ncbi:MAG: 4Fe-4S binding protein [Candidatus Omnitrophica bacterium]|nr:4Fe-4S binding protein [Candidatus Omnitrophota bacterium]
MDKGKLPKIDYPECILCGKCITICPKENLEPENCSHEDRK